MSVHNVHMYVWQSVSLCNQIINIVQFDDAHKKYRSLLKIWNIRYYLGWDIYGYTLCYCKTK